MRNERRTAGKAKADSSVIFVILFSLPVLQFVGRFLLTLTLVSLSVSTSPFHCSGILFHAALSSVVQIDFVLSVSLVPCPLPILRRTLTDSRLSSERER